jgi:hypothetical protein
VEGDGSFDVVFLSKLESLLNTEDGLNLTDSRLAGWLAEYLQCP